MRRAHQLPIETTAVPVTSRPLEDVLTDLGKFEGEEPETWRIPESTLGKALNRLFKMFGR